MLVTAYKIRGQNKRKFNRKWQINIREDEWRKRGLSTGEKEINIKEEGSGETETAIIIAQSLQMIYLTKVCISITLL